MEMIVVSAPGHIGDPGLSSTPGRASEAVKQVLFVDPDPSVCQLARRALQFVADVQFCTDFAAARARCLASPPDLLVTNVRLGAHNGLHLLHLLKRLGATTRCVVYGTEADLPLAREVQEMGAFIIWTPRLPIALQTFVTAELPQRDRRDPALPDRRRMFRGGRRSTDG
jgi:DNA-binding NtrC family response regulator